jgi:hypothetical protein
MGSVAPAVHDQIAAAPRDIRAPVALALLRCVAAYYGLDHALYLTLDHVRLWGRVGGRARGRFRIVGRALLHGHQPFSRAPTRGVEPSAPLSPP